MNPNHPSAPHAVCGTFRELPRQHDGAITLGGRRRLHGGTEQLFHGSAVADALVGLEDREWDRPFVAREYRLGIVGGRIVVHDEPVVPVELAQNATHLPQQDANRRGFVMSRDADVDHGPLPP